MGTKTVKLTNESVGTLPNDKPVVYKILNKRNENLYTGVAGKGEVRNRIKNHIRRPSDKVPGGTKVKIEQLPSRREAEKKEANIISRSKPKYNKQGK
jgi:excinuclease UvrABC nuclease subunit